MEEWELSKENVQPLRKGRRDLELLDCGLKAKTDASMQSALSEQRRILLENIDDYSGDDPLEPWLKCIAWTKEAFPTGGLQSGILPMLELCLRTFYSDARYKEDSRYLRLWMDYADRCSDPKDIFRFLETNDIGQTHAVFYESHAACLEHYKNYSKANDVFQIGIARLADSDELKRKYKSFLERAARDLRGGEDVNDDEETCMRAFGSLKMQQSGPRVGLRSSSKGSAATLAVFVDEDCQQAQKSLPREVNRATASYFATQAERNKENVQQPSKWTKAKIQPKNPTTRVARVAPAQALDVFVDEEFERKVHAPPRKRAPVAASLRLRLDLDKDAEAIRQAPLRKFLDG